MWATWCSRLVFLDNIRLTAGDGRGSRSPGCCGARSLIARTPTLITPLPPEAAKGAAAQVLEMVEKCRQIEANRVTCLVGALEIDQSPWSAATLMLLH